MLAPDCGRKKSAMTLDGDHSAQSTPGNGTQIDNEHQLRRVLTLPLVVLYGLGVTIGAGIYVLTAGTAFAVWLGGAM